MKTQISRNSFSLDKGYSGVFQQMGRMLTDADWNEQSSISRERLAQAIADIIGSGTPRQNGFVRLDSSVDPAIASLFWGTAYVDGIRASVKPTDPATATAEFDYLKQQDFPLAPELPSAPYQLYLDVWERTITYLEDSELRDPGLYGADTCTRTQTQAQVKWCPQGVDLDDRDINPDIGNSQLSLVLRSQATAADGCDPCSSELSLGVDIGNYLFRVEVHHVEYNTQYQPQKVILKWSSENGAEAYPANHVPADFINSNVCYEYFSDDTTSFASEKHLGKHLASGFTPSRHVAIENDFINPVPADFPYVRRWDGWCELVKNGANWQVVANKGKDKNIELSASIPADTPGHSRSDGNKVIIELSSLTLQLQLADFRILAGDYWGVAVREITLEPNDSLLTDSEPNGIRHHYLNLGEMTIDGLIPNSNLDCKTFEFPRLTDLNADDVCYDNQCKLPDVQTVKDALDHLCQENDLRFHNKHLHGWGIVCGLILECAETSATGDAVRSTNEIVIKPGYALDCDGTDLLIDDQQTLDVLKLIKEHSDKTLLDASGNGSISIRLERDTKGNIAFELERYNPSDATLKHYLDDSLLMDFYQDCIVDLVKIFQTEFQFLGDNNGLDSLENKKGILISPQRKRTISILNVLAYLTDKKQGQYVYLSHREHIILEEFYNKLRDLLKSKTYCSMFQDSQFPDYPFPEEKSTTWFGKAFHQHMYSHSTDPYAFTWNDTEGVLHIYDKSKGELVFVETLPKTVHKDSLVSAVCRRSETSFYLSASVKQTSYLLYGEIIEKKIKWSEPFYTGVYMTALESSSEDGLFYGIGKRQGFYQLQHNRLFDTNRTITITPFHEFNAYGSFVIDKLSGKGYATAMQKGTGSSQAQVYTHIARFSLTNKSLLKVQSILDQKKTSRAGKDEIAISPFVKGLGIPSRLFIVVDGLQGGKELLSVNVSDDKILMADASLNLENTKISLAALPFDVKTGAGVVVGLAGSHRLQVVDLQGKGILIPRVPVQMRPTDLALNATKTDSSSKTLSILSLNQYSNTITKIPVNELFKKEEQIKQLVKYRYQLTSAYFDLLGNVVQYLKDCLCHHLLVKCPTCDDEKIYLGSVEILNNQVQKVCNFHKRKYVKSFPTVDYWLSLIPVVPMVSWAIERVCCLVLPDIFANRKKGLLPQPSFDSGHSENAMIDLNSSSLHYYVESVHSADSRIFSEKILRGMKLQGELKMTKLLGMSRPDRLQALDKDNIDYKEWTVDAAKIDLKDQGYQVATEAYDPAKANHYLKVTELAPTTLKPGSKVNLIERNGKVMFYSIEHETKAGGIVSIPDALKDEIKVLEGRKNVLENLSAVESRFSELEARKVAFVEVAGIEDKFDALSVRKDRIKDFSTINDELAKIQSMRTELAEFSSIKTEISGLLAKKSTLKKDMGVLENDVKSLQTIHDQELVKLDQIRAEQTKVATSLDNALKEHTELNAKFTKLSNNFITLAETNKDLLHNVKVNQPIGTLGIAKSNQKKMQSIGIVTVNDLAKAKPAVLRNLGMSTAVVTKMLTNAKKSIL